MRRYGRYLKSDPSTVKVRFVCVHTVNPVKANSLIWILSKEKNWLNVFVCVCVCLCMCQA